MEAEMPGIGPWEARASQRPGGRLPFDMLEGGVGFHPSG